MKINLGRVQHKKVKMPTQVVDVNTTHDFGFLQPMCGCYPLVPDSTLKLRHSSFVRFHQLPFPTFGRVEQKTYHYFVPIADVFHPFESMLAGKPYNGVGGSYVPERVPSAPLCDLSMLCFLNSQVSIYELTGSSTEQNLTIVGGAGHVEGINSACANAFILRWISDKIVGFQANFEDYANANTLYLFDDSIRPNNADVTIYFTYNGKKYVGCYKLTEKGRNIRKVLIGLGYKLANVASMVSLLPLFCYLKVFYDYWYPKREFTWKDTDAFRFMELVEQNNLSYTEYYDDPCFIDSFDSLAFCYYYQNPDFYTAQTGSVALSDVTTRVNVVDAIGSNAMIGSQVVNSQAQLSSPVQHPVSYTQIKALEFISKFINKNTAIGGKIDDYLRVHYGADYIQKDNSYYIGCDVNEITISDVMSNSDTSGVDADGNMTGASLGEYAGKGLGYKEGNNFTIKANTFGYYINMCVVVPVSRFNQGVDPCLSHVGRFDFYLPEFDGMTLVPTRKSNLYADALFARTKGSDAFGYMPIYTEFKMRPQNILNGDMSRNGNRYYLGYQLDKMFNRDEYMIANDANTNYVLAKRSEDITNSLSPNTELRTIGLYPEFENFDRIFADGQTNQEMAMDANTHALDHVISHNVFEFDYIAPMLPYSDTFDTDAFRDAFKTEKA